LGKRSFVPKEGPSVRLYATPVVIINYLGKSKPHDAILIETDEKRRVVYLSHLAKSQTSPVKLSLNCWQHSYQTLMFC